MTYCVGVQVNEGLVFLSDSRTNAGVDHISTFRKMMFFEIPGERAIVLLSAGNLATSQSVTGLLRERVNSAKASLVTIRTLADAARLVGDAVRDVYTRDADALKQHGIEFNPTFIVGGQIGGEPPRLFHVYSAGNYIETTSDTRYFQIGESKYGKPIIDRGQGGHLAGCGRQVPADLHGLDHPVEPVRGHAAGPGHRPAGRPAGFVAPEHRHGRRLFQSDPGRLGRGPAQRLPRPARPSHSISRRT